MRVGDGAFLALGDGMSLMRATEHCGDQCVAVVDPPWDAGLWPDISRYASSLVFCDGQRAGDVIRSYGPPAWVFVWDCQSCWYTPNRPIKKHKLCLWYGDAASYADVFRDGSAIRPSRATNSRGSYNYTPSPHGKRLIDVWGEKITAPRFGGVAHAKPIRWVSALIQNCASKSAIVVDPFAGSGAVAVAAMMAGKCYLGTEIDIDAHAAAVKNIISFCSPEQFCLTQ